MKKIFILGVSAALLAGGISSCKKTSKGKFSNEWTVSEMTVESSYIGSSGGSGSESISIKDKSGTSTEVDTYSGTSNTTTKSGVINEYVYTIEKDGSYKTVKDVVWTESFTGGSTSVATKTTTTGSWTFLSKNKTAEFKKNELVAFYPMVEEEVETTTTTVGGTSTSSSSTEKYDYSGKDYADIYKVIESKRKELQLSTEYDDSNSSTTSTGTSTSSRKSKSIITLIQK